MVQEIYPLLLDAAAREAKGEMLAAVQCYREASALNPGYAVPFTRLSTMMVRALWGMPPAPRPQLSDDQNRVGMTTLGSNGRFGNQLFQYAYLRLYADACGCAVEMPDWIGRDLFGCDDPLPSIALPVFRETEFDTPVALQATVDHAINVDLYGYFDFPTQHWQPFRHRFRDLFHLRPPVQQWLNAIYAGLGTEGKTVVAIHIRHGDFGGSHFWIAPTQWYKTWLRALWPQLEQPLLFVATDDPAVLTEFAEYHPLSSQQLTFIPEDIRYLIDFFVLTKADFVATSNSTFSFVSAMINEKSRSTVRPDPMARGLVAFDPWDAPIRLHNPWLAEETACSAAEKSILERMVPDGSVVFDLGAKRGEWLRAVQATGKQDRFYAFEPEPVAFSALACWSEITRPTTVTVIHTPPAVVVSPKPDRVWVRLKHWWQRMTHATPRGDKTAGHDHANGWATVAPVLIDAFCAEHGIPHIHFLRIDSRYSALAVLHHATRLLRHARIDAIQFQGTGVALREVFQCLRPYGYLFLRFDASSSVWIPQWTDDLGHDHDAYYVAIHARLAPYYGLGHPRTVDIAEIIDRHGVTARGVIQIGARYGAASEIAEISAIPQLRIEADPKAFEEISKHHGNAPNTVLLNRAITDTNGTVRFYVNHVRSCSSCLKPGFLTVLDPQATVHSEIAVPCSRLDDLLLALGAHPSTYNLLTIDVRGAELGVLRGAGDWLRNFDLLHTTIYFADLYEGGASLDAIDDALASHGFRRIELVSPSHPAWGEAVYLRKEAPLVYRTAPSCQIGTLATLLTTHLGARRHGCFVEVGAFDGELCSNTSFLADLGWRGLYIEPIPAYAQACMRRHAHNTAVDVVPVAVGSKAGVHAFWDVGILTTGDPTMTALYGAIPWTKDSIAAASVVQVQSERLETLLHRYGIVPRFDLLVIDVGGQEEEVLHSFSIEDWQPRVIIVALSDDHPDFGQYAEIQQRCANVRQRLSSLGYREVYRDEINTLFAKSL